MKIEKNYSYCIAFLSCLRVISVLLPDFRQPAASVHRILTGRHTASPVAQALLYHRAPVSVNYVYAYKKDCEGRYLYPCLHSPFLSQSLRNCLRTTCASDLSKHPYAASESLAVVIVNELNKFVYDNRSAKMRTDFVRKYAAFSRQNPAQETLKAQAFCSFPISLIPRYSPGMSRASLRLFPEEVPAFRNPAP